PWTQGSWVRALWDRHNYMWDFHSNLTSPHTYESPSWAWVLLKRPVSYFFCSGDQCNPRVDEGDYVEIFAAGSPFVWWAAVLALFYLAFVWARKRDIRRPEGVILAGVALTYGPWLLPMTNRSTMFLFYFLPTVPFLGLALAYVATRIGESWEAKAAIGLFCAGALASFIWYFPMVASVPIPQQDWDKRIWVFDNCEKPPGVPTTETTTQTSGAAVVTTTFTTNDNSSLPPIGWCWI
ncbi:MAG: hypothetical protein M3214_01155, partial [Actinomycetota bacterium]|nr:hypothetical protein [Actinomycetota bacterium]